MLTALTWKLSYAWGRHPVTIDIKTDIALKFYNNIHGNVWKRYFETVGVIVLNILYDIIGMSHF